MKILIIALSGIGDALMFTPAVKFLKENMPDAQIDAMVMFGGVKDIYSRLPQIDNVFHHDFLEKSPLESLKFVLKLRGKYDMTFSVYPSNRKEYNIISRLTGAKKRAGVKYIRQDNGNLGFLNNIRVNESDSSHNVETNVKMVAAALGLNNPSEISPLQFPLSENELSFAETFRVSSGISPEDLLIGFHPGCSTMKNHINRRWEPGKFVELGKKLISQKNAKILIFGGPEEMELKSGIVDKISSGNCIPVVTSNLAESAAVMKMCNLFITNDSSLMHVASAMQLKTIAIIGPTNTNYIKPWKTEHRIVSLNLDCSPCFFYSPKPLSCSRQDVQYKCVKELSPEMVYEEALRFMEEKERK